jgi:hypothetical protein
MSPCNGLVRASVFLFACLFGIQPLSAAPPANGRPNQSDKSEKIPVICPAIEQEGPGMVINGPPGPQPKISVELVVLGKVKPPDESAKEPYWELQVQKVLYGTCVNKVFRVSPCPGLLESPPAEPRIFVFTSERYVDNAGAAVKEMKESLPTREEKWQAALASARLVPDSIPLGFASHG